MTILISNFIEAVKKMRAYQKEYFRTRNKDILSASKYMEKQVDTMLADFDAPNLFNESSN